ncbi:PaaI family thioesterase [Sphingomonas sp. 1P06PA]|uniref:PaaI family thioesterase n=1 Tax=Sphingomonas sp. 1P06PA TaxID=554121 RepID=UPI0039A4ABBB
MTELPPYARLLGIALAAGGDGAPELMIPYGDQLLGRPGFLHGGAIAGILEIAAYAALRHALGNDAVTLKPISVTIDYLRGGRQRETRAAGRVVRIGGRVANMVAEAWQDDRANPIAAIRMNLMIER